MLLKFTSFNFYELGPVELVQLVYNFFLYHCQYESRVQDITTDLTKRKLKEKHLKHFKNKHENMFMNFANS